MSEDEEEDESSRNGGYSLPLSLSVNHPLLASLVPHYLDRILMRNYSRVFSQNDLAESFSKSLQEEEEDKKAVLETYPSPPYPLHLSRTDH